MAATSSRSAAAPRWARYSDEELLDLRLSDLRITLAGTALEPRLARLYDELAARDLRLRPHAWLSTEWFSPDGTPGIAIPFYLAHPRLRRLEEAQISDVEGGTPEALMQLLRHETAHAMDSAFRLHRRASWRETFGLYSTAYRRDYKPKPYSRHYVHHLDYWYAQSHPAEDWAETFSVWLATPRAKWRAEYAGWPALKKLEYVDGLMAEIAGKPPLVRNKDRVDPIAEIPKTLRRYYADRLKARQLELPNAHDHELEAIFGPKSRAAYDPPETAAAFLQRHRKELRTSIAPKTGESPFIVDQVLRRVSTRLSKLRLYVVRSEQRTYEQARSFLTAHTMRYIHSGRLTRSR